MSVIESPSNANVGLEVDPTHKAGRISLRPIEHHGAEHVGGHYRLAARSGVLTGAGIIAAAPLFSFRWTEQAKVAIVTLIEAFLVPTAAFTATQELGLQGILASNWTANDSAGTAIDIATGGRMRRLDQNPSDVGMVRIADTTLLTAGTRTRDAFPFVAGEGLVHDINAAAGTAFVNPRSGPVPFGFRYQPIAGVDHPITLRRNEGFIIENLVAFPAAGDARLVVNLAWAEVSTF